MSSKKNLIKNVLASLFQKGVIVLDKLFLIPFFITYWGVEYYGEWLTLTIVPSILAFSNLGFGTAAANTFVLRYTKGDKQGAANVAKSTLLIITGLVTFGLCLTALVVLTLYYLNVFDKSLLDPEQAMIAVTLLMLSQLINFYQQLFEAYFRAAREAAKSINLKTVYGLINLMAGMVVLVLGGDIVHFALASLLVSIIFNPIFAIFGIKAIQLNVLRYGVINKEDIVNSFKKGVGFLASPIWQAIFFQGTTLAVRLTIGPQGVTIFNTIRALTRSVNQLFQVIGGSVFPELQFEIGKGNMEKARQLFRVANIATALAAIVGMLLLSIFGLWFYNVWTQNVLQPPIAMWYIFVLSVGFNALWWSSSIVFRAMNQPKKMAFAGLLGSCIAVTATYFLSKLFGLTGAAMGTLLLDLFLGFYLFYNGSKLIGQRPTKIVSDFFKNDLKILKKVVKFK